MQLEIGGYCFAGPYRECEDFKCHGIGKSVKGFKAE